MGRLGAGLGLSQYRVSAAPAVPWTPLMLGGKLPLWLDAEDPSTVVEVGGLVSEWQNKLAPAERVAQAATGSKPVYDLTGLAGRPAVVFDGVDDMLASSAIPSLSSLPQSRSLWAVAENLAPPETAGSRTLVRFGGATASRNTIGRSSSGINRMRATSGDGTTETALVNVTALLAGPSVLHVKNTGAVLTSQLNDAEPVSMAVASALTNAVLNVGALTSTLNYWHGPINTVLITSELTAHEEAALRSYLKARI